MTTPCAARFPGGFSLIEVTLAIGVAAFCLVALFGLLPVGINTNQTTLAQTAAAGIAANVVADLRATQVTATPTPSPLYAIPVPALITDTPRTHTIFFHEDGSVAVQPGTNPGVGNTVDVDANAKYDPRYRLTLIYPTPVPGASPAPRAATPVKILVTWPATADPKAASTPTNFSGSFEAVTALDHR